MGPVRVRVRVHTYRRWPRAGSPLTWVKGRHYSEEGMEVLGLEPRLTQVHALKLDTVLPLSQTV